MTMMRRRWITSRLDWSQWGSNENPIWTDGDGERNSKRWMWDSTFIGVRTWNVFFTYFLERITIWLRLVWKEEKRKPQRKSFFTEVFLMLKSLVLIWSKWRHKKENSFATYCEVRNPHTCENKKPIAIIVRNETRSFPMCRTSPLIQFRANWISDNLILNFKCNHAHRTREIERIPFDMHTSAMIWIASQREMKALIPTRSLHSRPSM